MRISRLTKATVLVATMLVAFPVFAAKGGNGGGNGDGGGKPGDDHPPPPQPQPTSCPGDFPAFAYAVEIIAKIRGNRFHTVRSDLKVSNADGSCEMIVHSVATAVTYDDLTFDFDSDWGKYRIAYNYQSDDTDTEETGGRPNIRVLEFSVSDDQGDTKIDQALPLEIHKIYRFSGSNVGGMDLSGGALVFSESERFIGEVYRIKIIESVGDCISNLGPEPDDSCAGPVAFQSSTPENPNTIAAVFPRWGVDTSRIYFHYHGYGLDGNGTVLAFIDRSGPSWSAPGAVTDYGNDGGDFFHSTVALWDHDGSGPSEVVTVTVGGDDGTLQILDIGDGCTAVASATSPCLDQGLATIVPVQTNAPHGRWTSHTTIDTEKPNLLFFDKNNNTINELDPVSGIDTEIIGVLRWTTWWWFDPVD